jgi:hypothetical protein
MRFSQKCTCCTSIVETKKSTKIDDVRCESCLLKTINFFEKWQLKAMQEIFVLTTEVNKIKAILSGGVK